MNWNILPDLIALTVLVGVFASLMRRANDDALSLWLVAWCLILTHFVARLIVAPAIQLELDALSIWTLQAAGLFFMWGVTSKYAGRADIPLLFAYGLPQLALGGLSIWNVENRVPYVALLVLAVALPVAVGYALVRRADYQRLILVSTATLALPLGAAITLGHDVADLSIIVLLTWVYIWSGVLYWRRATRPTVGVSTTLFGFIAWALVFPLGEAQAMWFSQIHIDGTAWNIPKYIVAIGIIVTLLERQIERSSFLALHDELTGLPNRRCFEDRLARTFARARPRGMGFALLTIDLDRFKSINDNLGHRAGDQFLCAVAARLDRCMREGDMCARYGGDEFVVIVEDLTCRLDAERRARELIASLSDPVVLGGVDVAAAASIGIAVYPEDGRDADTLHAASDNAMYVSKRMRRVSYARG